MLLPDPRELRTLLARFADVRITLVHRHDPALQRELDDISYSLCVMTGTRELADALAAADAILAEPRRAHPAREAAVQDDITVVA
ncbi:DUF5133 domain-containing protein [Streptomyces sp. NPDC006368]|uniref:DUF5133 domain-containing protein n=1 Tax=Streptomyces sp. NPDC006368 TaxID=3156760 RepID=UPI0033A2506C